MDMIESRKLTVHTYNEETAEQIAQIIVNSYWQMFEQLQIALERIRNSGQKQLFNNGK
jgi:hypothetical protein